MQIYMVGGAVRDRLLGRPVNDHDWVVVGATPEQMLELGYAGGPRFSSVLRPKRARNRAGPHRARAGGATGALWWRARPTSHWKTSPGAISLSIP